MDIKHNFICYCCLLKAKLLFLYFEIFLFQNMPIERIWPEVNSRVNYPIKYILVRMDNDGIINMENETEKFCVSFVTCEVAKVGMERTIGSWNFHRIPGIALLILISIVNRREGCKLPFCVNEKSNFSFEG